MSTDSEMSTGSEGKGDGDVKGSVKMIKLQTADGKTFEWPEEMAKMSLTIKELMEHAGGEEDSTPIPLTNVGSPELEIAQKYCEYHLKNKDKSEIELKEWDTALLDIDRSLLTDVISAANYLDMENLMDAGTAIYAKEFKGKTLDEIREIVGIECDLSAEQLKSIESENKWIEDN